MNCTQCRLSFDANGSPVYAPLAPKNGFLCCTVCGCSYGAAFSSDGRKRGWFAKKR